jgi:hypothetical protein
MKIKIISILVFAIVFTLNINAQTKLVGEKYTAHTGSSCKELQDGGCMIDYYCELKFEKDSVLVLNYMKASCSPPEKNSFYNNQVPQKTKYRYNTKNNIITIKDFNVYGELKIVGKKLIGKKGMNYNEFVSLEFKQE